MRILKQPEHTNLCGQACVAMITDSTIKEVSDLIGKGGKTQNKDLVRALKDLKVKCVPRKVKRLPECDTAIVKVRYCKGWNHWVLWFKGNIIDPGNGIKMDAESYLTTTPVVVLSHIEVNLKRK